MEKGEFLRISKDINSGFLVALLPDGKLIPMQNNLIISNSKEDKGQVEITVSFKIPIQLLKIEDSSDLTNNL